MAHQVTHFVKPEHEPSHQAATRSGSPRGSARGSLQGPLSGLSFVLWPAGSGSSPSLRSGTYALDRRSRQRGNEAEKSLTIKVYVAENPVNVHDFHMSSGNPSHGASSSGRRTVRRGTIAEAWLVRNWKRCVVRARRTLEE